MPDHAPTRKGQQSMHAYGGSQWQPDPDPDATNFRKGYFQSTEDWAFDQRDPEAVVTFDMQSMEVKPPCLPLGTWEASSRHGQTVITQHPRPYRRNYRSVLPLKDDVVLDTAQLQALIELGAPLHLIPAACQRQQDWDLRHDAFARHFTSALRLGCELTQQWGVPPLLWDQNYHSLVSAEPDDIL